MSHHRPTGKIEPALVAWGELAVLAVLTAPLVATLVHILEVGGRFPARLGLAHALEYAFLPAMGATFRVLVVIAAVALPAPWSCSSCEEPGSAGL